jgi:tRNA-2-methylthio-N6-dimethylallyladenosine synthase
MTDGKKVYIKTWGCQMNVYDADRMREVVAPLGYAPTSSPDDADIVIFNTCHIREKAAEKLFSELGRLRETQLLREARGEKMWIAVAGCVAQAEGAEIQRRMPFVDMVFGPQAYHQLPEMIAKLMRTSKTVLNTDFPPEPKFDHLPARSGNSPVSAFLAVQEGCDRFCTYCVVPYTRGAEYARPVEDIVVETKQLVANGAREIVLLGQNVNAYRDQNGGLAKLIRRIAEIDGVLRLRYTTSHPNSMDDDLISAHRDVPQLMPFLHLPVQSGSDSILKAMNRKHTADDYLRIVDKIRQARPDIALSSDFIVGFPGETDADYKATCELVKKVGFAQAFSFKYSPRAGTPAAAMPNQIAESVKNERLVALQEILESQQDSFNKSLVGKKISILFETLGKKAGQIRGRTPFLQTIHVDGPTELLGREAMVTVTKAEPHALFGVLT